MGGTRRSWRTKQDKDQQSQARQMADRPSTTAASSHGGGVSDAKECTQTYCVISLHSPVKGQGLFHCIFQNLHTGGHGLACPPATTSLSDPHGSHIKAGCDVHILHASIDLFFICSFLFISRFQTHGGGSRRRF